MMRLGLKFIAFSLALALLACLGLIALGRIMASPILSFIVNQDGERDLYLADSRTRLLYNLSQSEADEWSFAWSPDGEQVLYSASAEQGTGDKLLIMHANTGQIQNLDKGASLLAFSPVWSANGTEIAYYSSHPHNVSDLYSIDLRTQQLQNRSQTPESSEQHPLYSPDGTYLAYLQTGDIYFRELATGASQPITQTDSNESLLAWSPDGRYLVFLRGLLEPRAVLLELATLQEHEILSPTHLKAAPVSWSNDSRAFTFVLSNDALVVYDLASESIRTLKAANGQRRLSPVWSPDGQFVAFIENGSVQALHLATQTEFSLAIKGRVLPLLAWQK